MEVDTNTLLQKMHCPTEVHFTTPGNWSEPSNWQYGTLPGANDEVFIDAPCQLDQNATVADLTITANQSLTMQAGKTLTVTDTLTNSVVSALVIEDSAQLIHNNIGVQATVKKTISGYGTSLEEVLSGPIAPFEGFFYYTTETRNVYFSRTAPAGLVP